MKPTIDQDLHIHTVYSHGDPAIEPQQTTDMIESLAHARVIGISDHYEYLPPVFDKYREDLHRRGFWCGCEINTGAEVPQALELPFDYYIYHCRDRDSEYRGAEQLADSGKPVIISHPMAMGADLNRVPTDCYIEINNRYVWKGDYMSYYTPHRDRFRFVLGSDAHKPNWLNHVYAVYAAQRLGIVPTQIFDAPYGSGN